MNFKSFDEITRINNPKTTTFKLKTIPSSGLHEWSKKVFVFGLLIMVNFDTIN